MKTKITLTDIKKMPLNYYYMKVEYHAKGHKKESTYLKEEWFYKNISRIA
jgi:hypothetical protein